MTNNNSVGEVQDTIVFYRDKLRDVSENECVGEKAQEDIIQAVVKMNAAIIDLNRQ